MANNVNMKFARAVSGTPLILASGFVFASITPESTSTYSITNSMSGDIPPALKISPSLSGVFSFPDISNYGKAYHTHTITVLTGTAVDIAFVDGN